MNDRPQPQNTPAPDATDAASGDDSRKASGNHRVVIVGGYGAFGAKVAERLARDPALEIVIAGRSRAKAQAYADKLARAVVGSRISFAVLDAQAATPDDIRVLAPTVLINASGPFQQQDYSLARACIAARCHYIDLADAREFVCGITQLDEAARGAGVCVISGASSVPGLSSAVVLHLSEGLRHLDEVHIGISPGNAFDPGLTTTRSIIGAAGKPFEARQDHAAVKRYGWQGLSGYTFPLIGRRWMCDVDVPDLELFPRHLPGIASVRFTAGLEVSAYHLGFWALSWPARFGIVRSLAPLARPLLWLKRRLHWLGSDAGGMFVRIEGRDPRSRLTRAWHLIARSNHGPYVPAIASVVLARRLIAGTGPAAGAMACFGPFTLAEFEAEVADLDIISKVDLRGRCSPYGPSRSQP
ncbi:saccharopine dehydrogenase NADP-binding domain-containing protein [Hyphomicrobium sulfonivorans]|uniref:saccharopine dehydrogenase NADP-binding domain-containing protein n=1 Tax=Hyphomicrobium sulfonivorans TaxID=121290 RepID=UPI00156DE3BD|nr:saccharopine dehydrogenase NADP-binding domain-containing protein [Hyphomicrobium sulfonivorans]NSL70836.1 hypothetical protein [Hyphomicrobium sulfonivorans]